MVKRSVSSAMAATLVATVIIIIVIASYATLSFNNGSSETSITCSESIATFTVIQNGTAQGLIYPIPADPCQHQVSLSGFSLSTTGNLSNTLRGNVNVDSHSPLITFIVYVNGTYELYSDLSHSGSAQYSIQYNAVLNNATLPIISGMSYAIEFVALFKDGTATTATTIVNATE